MCLDRIRTVNSTYSVPEQMFPCNSNVYITFVSFEHARYPPLGSHTNTFCRSVWFEGLQMQTCEYELYRHPHTRLHPLSCSSPPALSTTPYLLLSACLLWASSLVPFLFSISSLFLAARAPNGAEVFHQSSLVVFRVLCLPKVPGSCLDLWENTGTMTR